MSAPAITKVQHCTTMQDVRRQVDALDDILVPLLVERVGYMTQAARIKQHNVQRVRQHAHTEGGSPEVIEAIYRSMMEACIAHEHREFARLRTPQGEQA